MPRGVGSGKDELSAGLAIEAITDDSALDALCQELRTIFDAHSHQIMTFGGQPAGAVLHNTTFPSDALRAYEAYYASKDLWALEVMRRPLPGVFVSQELVPDSAIAESEIHEDFGRNFFLDIRHMICVIHPIAPLRYMCISMHRSKSGEPFSRLSKSKLVSLAPILSATLGARSVFADLKLRAGLGFSALDAIGKPVMVVDRNACLRFANRAADELQKQTRWPIFHAPEGDGLLGLCAGHAGLPLRNAVATITNGRSPSEEVVVHVGDREMPATVMPLSTPVGVGGPQGFAMILLHVRDSDRGLCASRVRIVLGLTLAEAELAVALAEGETLDEYSVRRELSIHTVRWTLKQAMAKTETHRQAEFVGKVLRDVARL